jgi:hypothetical protein
MNCSGQGFFPASGANGEPSANPSRPTGSLLWQRILRVSTDVHNNKDMGP